MNLNRKLAVIPSLVAITGETLTVEELIQVTDCYAPVLLSEYAQTNINLGRQVLLECAAQGQEIYGMNTKLGPYVHDVEPVHEEHEHKEHEHKEHERKEHKHKEHEHKEHEHKEHEHENEHDEHEHQLAIIHEHIVQHGEELHEREVRAMMLVRLNGMARGTSGVRLQVAQAIANLLNAGITPVVHGGSSVGASDLSEMAQIASVLTGHGEAHYMGKRLSGERALAAAGLRPLRLAAKEGLSLISYNGCSIGQAALTFNEMLGAFRAINLSAAMTLEAYRANLSMLHRAAYTNKAHEGYKNASLHISELLRGSSLWNEGQSRHLQDPLSFRCLPLVHGVLMDELASFRKTLEIELNSSCDNPLVDIEFWEVVSVGNFDSTALSVGLDKLRIAVANALNIANERIQKMLSNHHSGLSTGLKTESHQVSGLIPLARVAAALSAEVAIHANPVSFSHRSQLGSGLEDHCSMAPLSVAETRKLLAIWIKLAAIEALVANHALTIRPLEEQGVKTQQVSAQLRKEPLTCRNWNEQLTECASLLGRASVVMPSELRPRSLVQ